MISDSLTAPKKPNAGYYVLGRCEVSGITHFWSGTPLTTYSAGNQVTSQLRVETFNLFNHTQFAGVSTTVSTSGPGAALTTATINGLGQVNSTRDHRTIQLRLKIYF